MSPDGNLIAYRSLPLDLMHEAEANPSQFVNNDEYNIWKVNALTKENILVQGDIGGLDNLAISDDKSPRNPVFSYNDENVFFSRKTHW